MDLFDLGRFFEMDVPVKASSCPLLLYGAVALSAKALGRFDNNRRAQKAHGLGYTSSQWLHKARMYYDKAIGLLRQALDEEVRPSSRHSRQLSESSMSPMSSRTLPRAESDELVGTSAILCVYEFLDASGIEWSRHLDGAKSLFDIAKDSVIALGIASPYSNPQLQSSASSKTRIAVFWNIVRQDMLDACMSSVSTRLY